MTTFQELAQDAASCTRCDLYKRATATVFGEGKARTAAFREWRGLVVSTIRPSALLRGDDPESRERSYAGLVEDLVTARQAAAAGLRDGPR